MYAVTQIDKKLQLVAHHIQTSIHWELSSIVHNIMFSWCVSCWHILYIWTQMLNAVSLRFAAACMHQLLSRSRSGYFCLARSCCEDEATRLNGLLVSRRSSMLPAAAAAAVAPWSAEPANWRARPNRGCGLQKLSAPCMEVWACSIHTTHAVSVESSCSLTMKISTKLN